MGEVNTSHSRKAMPLRMLSSKIASWILVKFGVRGLQWKFWGEYNFGSYRSRNSSISVATTLLIELTANSFALPLKMALERVALPQSFSLAPFAFSWLNSLFTQFLFLRPLESGGGFSWLWYSIVGAYHNASPSASQSARTMAAPTPIGPGTASNSG
jgi:hypothetical protein